MSTAAATAAAADAPSPAPKGKKKLILIVAAALLVVLIGGGAAFMLLKKKGASEDAEDAETTAAAESSSPKRDPKATPAYMPLDLFTVNLADREAERYAQVGITLELADAKDGDRFKTFMPAIRNNILMVLAHKTAAELLEKEGKLKLAGQVQRAASRAVGVEVAEPEENPAAEEDDAKTAKKKKGKKKTAQPALPVLAVHFSNFIVQ